MEFDLNDSTSLNKSNMSFDAKERFFHGLDLHVGIITGILLSFIISLTIFGNVLVLIAIYIYHHLRTTTNFFILNLACADLFLGLCVLPFSASLEILGYWPFGRFFCVVWASVDVLLCTASIMTLCVISVDRYIGVTRPLQHSRIMTKKRAYYVIFLVWILSFAISVGPLVGWKAEVDPDPRVCRVNDQVAYVIFSTAGSFYIPMFIIIFVYVRIYREAIRHTTQLLAGINTKTRKSEGIILRIHTGRNSQKQKLNTGKSHHETPDKKLNSKGIIASKIAKFKREKKAAKTLGIVVGVFILCWFPFFFCLPLGALCTTCYIPDLLFKITFWLGYCNSMMNPIIYGFSSRDFKRAFKRILRCEQKRTSTPLSKMLELSVSNSEINHSMGNLIKTPLRHNGHGSYQPCRQYYTSQISCDNDSPTKEDDRVGSPNSLSPPRQSHLGSNWRGNSCDSDTGSLSENQFEALRLEQIEQNSIL